MNSQLNKNNDNQEQMISEDQFRTVFFDSGKRACQSSSELNKRARLDVPTVPSPPASTATSPNTNGSKSLENKTSPSTGVSAVSAASENSCTGSQDASKAGSENVSSVAASDATSTLASNVCEKQKNQDKDLSRDSSLRFNTCSSSRRTRSRSLPNLTFAHRRYRSQPAAVLNNITTATKTEIVSGGRISKEKQQKISKHFSQTSAATTSFKRSHRHSHIRSHNLSFNGSDTSSALLPPVNTQSLREIDLQEILKNPQLRHDILFDPQLQFRPNLDGERGRRKKQVVDKYWSEVEEECKEYMKASNKMLTNSGGITLAANMSKFHLKYSKLPRLFSTLRDILITLLPSKDRPAVYDVMDVDLLVQQLRKGVVDFVALAKWLANVFKSHCAPMRDAWVDEMTDKFVEADKENSIKKLIEGLRTIFSILEAMKLDVANHQIRVLRPALVETAVDFERDYFNQMISRRNLNIQDSLNWFANAYEKQLKKEGSEIASSTTFSRNVTVSAIIKLLSCREMATEFPSSLSFDHPRLILLRADVRQLVCLQICLYLYKQLASTYNKDPVKRSRLLLKSVLNDVKREILAVITDENGNVKWTRNIPSIAVQLAQRASMDLTAPPSSSASSAPPPASIVNFAHSWLLKQTQPRSDVYGLMEERIFTQLRQQVTIILDNNKSGSVILPSQIPKTATGNSLSSGASTPVSSTSASAGASSTTILAAAGTGSTSGLLTPVTPTGAGATGGQLAEEISSLAGRLSILTNFHWSVFGSHYSDAIKNEQK